MRRVLIFPVLCVSLAAGAACSRNDSDRTARTEAAVDQQAANRAGSADDQVEVRGCLTANTELNQYVLTADLNAVNAITSRAAATGERETYHYQLVGGTDLASHVGREVVVRGSITDDGKDVEIESKSRKTEQPTATTSRGEEVTPAIKSSEEIEMQVKRLQVASVTPTGSACQVGQSERR